MKRVIITALAVFLASAAVAGAFGVPIPFQLGEEYPLRMVYREDHRNCAVRPEDTVLLLEGARWRVARHTQPLILGAPVRWTQPRARTNEVKTIGNRPVAAEQRAGKRALWPRLLVQLGFLLLVVGGASLRNLGLDRTLLPLRLPELQGLCPFGAVRTLASLLLSPATPS